MSKHNASFLKNALKFIVFLVFLSGCKSINVLHESQNETTNIADNYPSIHDNKMASFALVDRHESQQWTSDLPYLVSYPLNWKFIFLKYVVSEDLYGNVDNGKVILLPIGLSLSKTSDGARPALYSSYEKQNDSFDRGSNTIDLNAEDPSANVHRTINRDTARYYFTLYSSFMVYFKNLQPINDENILSDLDLHNPDATETNLEELKSEVDYISSPIYLDRDLDMLPFNNYNNGVLEITSFYTHFYNEGLAECPIFYNRYELAMKCFKDNVDTFETIKSRLIL